MGESTHLFKVDELGGPIEESSPAGDWFLINVVCVS